MMNCPRCGGLLVETYEYDLLVSGEALLQEKCVNCGHYTDPLMRSRVGRPAPVRALKQYKGSQATYLTAQMVRASLQP